MSEHNKVRARRKFIASPFCFIKLAQIVFYRFDADVISSALRCYQCIVFKVEQFTSFIDKTSGTTVRPLASQNISRMDRDKIAASHSHSAGMFQHNKFHCAAILN